MPALLAGIALLGLLMLLARGYTGASPRNLARGFRLSGGVLLVLLTVALVMTDRIAFAFVTASGAWFLLVGTVPPWQRTSSGPGPGQGRGGSSGPPRTTAMSRAEALGVLGLKEGATGKLRELKRFGPKYTIPAGS